MRSRPVVLGSLVLVASVLTALAFVLARSANAEPSRDMCLDRPAAHITRLRGNLTGSQGTSAPQLDQTWDLRGFSQTTNPDPTRYPFRIDKANRVCVIGGRVVGNIPRDWPREKWYHGSDTSAKWDGEGYRISQTRSSPWTYQYGSYVENVSDGFDPNGQAGVNQDYLEHVHAKYVRDDCIEVEGNGFSPHSVTVRDSLFDGCFNFLSMRPTGTFHADRGTAEGTFTLEDSLVYVQPQPLSADDCSNNPERCVNGRGNNVFFKWSKYAVKHPVVRNTVLRMDQPATASTRSMHFPAGTYENVTLVWTWPKPYTHYADLPEGVTVTNDVTVWERAKTRWLAASARGTASSGDRSLAPTNPVPGVNAGPDRPKADRRAEQRVA